MDILAAYFIGLALYIAILYIFPEWLMDSSLYSELEDEMMEAEEMALFSDDVDEGKTLVDGLQKDVHLLYLNAKGKQQGRLVTLKAITGKGNKAQYLYAHCHMRGAMRHFILKRVVQLSETHSGKVVHDVEEYIQRIVQGARR